MKAVLVDASSAILLFKAGLFTLLAEHYAVRMVAAVYREVTVDRRPGSRTFARMASDGRLAVIDAVSSPHGLDLPARLHRGEKETLCRFIAAPEAFLVLDDGRAATVCRRMSLPYICALLVPQIAYHTDLATAAERDDQMRTLEHLGRYSGEVIRYARDCTREHLMPFLP